MDTKISGNLVILMILNRFHLQKGVHWKIPTVLSLSLIGGAKAKMSTETSDLQDLLQNADQLFDENQYQEVVDILKKYSVRWVPN